MHGLSRSGEDETERINKDRRTDERGSLERGAVSAFRGGDAVAVGDRGCSKVLAATDDLALLVPLTRRVLARVAVPWARGIRTARAAFMVDK